MADRSTRDALLEQGALLYARQGVRGVSIRALHEAIGARNESALHYHFGSQQGLLDEILRVHLEAVERRRRDLLASLEAGSTDDVRSLVHALLAPMVDDLGDPIGRAHLRIVAQLSHPSLAYGAAFESAQAVSVEARAGVEVVRRLRLALASLSRGIRAERLADLRGHLVSAIGQRAQLIDDDPISATPRSLLLFEENLLDVLVAGLEAVPSAATLSALRARRPTA